MQLETERLLIRPFEPRDEAAAIAMFTDPDFMVWSTDRTHDADGARTKLRGLIDLYRDHGFSKLAVEAKGEPNGEGGGRVIGYCGFGREPLEGEMIPEFGYRLQRHARGRGLATEAARAVIADAFARLRLPFVQAIVEEANAPSRRVLDKLGMIFQRRVIYHERDLLLYRLDPPA